MSQTLLSPSQAASLKQKIENGDSQGIQEFIRDYPELKIAIQGFLAACAVFGLQKK